jgi:hypothetical protein
MKQEAIHRDLQESYWTGDSEVNCQIFCWVADNQELDVVEGSAPSEMDEESTHGFGIRGAGNVGALATRDRKTLDDGDACGSTGNLSGSRSGRAPLRSEHWERLESSHHRKNESRAASHRKMKPSAALKEETVIH